MDDSQRSGQASQSGLSTAAFGHADDRTSPLAAPQTDDQPAGAASVPSSDSERLSYEEATSRTVLSGEPEAEPSLEGTIADPSKAALKTVEFTPAFGKRGAPAIQAPEATGLKKARIQRFEILRTLGQGAFGTVHLAYDPHLDRQVAIKVAKTGVLVNDAEVQRFLREARSAAQLRHPNIVPVYEVGQVGGSNFIVYEYIPGRTLKALLHERKRLSCREAAEMLRKLAVALHYAHTHGIVHRDMKPENVLLDEHGEPHIADFGLARREDSDATFTREGHLLGTPAYMSPEQAAGHGYRADARSDIWSLGVMLEEMMLGARPFEGSMTEVLLAVRERDPVPIRQLDRSLPKDLETICLKCLTKSPAERYQTALELAEELERWLRGEPIHARPIGPIGRAIRWSRRNPAIAGWIATAGSILFLGAVISSYFAYDAHRSAKIAQEEQRNRALAQVTALATARPDSVPVLIESLAPFRHEVEGRLEDLWQSGELTPQAQVRVRLALVNLYPQQPRLGRLSEQLRADLLRAGAAEFPMITQLLEPHAERLTESLWEIARDTSADRDARFRAACALARFQPHSPHWDEIAPDVVATLSGESSLDLGHWLTVLRPVKDHLRGDLERLFRDEPNAERRQIAATTIADLYATEPEVLVGLFDAADPAQMAVLIPKLKQESGTARHLIGERLKSLQGAAVPQEDRPRHIVTLTNCALALVSLGAGDAVWPLLGKAEDQELRTRFIHHAGLAGLNPEILIQRLRVERDPLVLSALCLTLGEYDAAALPPSGRELLFDWLVSLYRSHPDSGVHSAAQWLLSRWFEPSRWAELPAGDPPSEQRWRVNSQGQTLARIAGPVEFLMGSPVDEPFRVFIELQHERQIPRSFEIGLHEVTVEQFLRFDPDFEYDRVVSPQPDCPINSVSWLDAIKYCRWLSEQEKIPEAEMCFPEVDKIGEGMSLPKDLLKRTGYRLPTAAEWEYACRAGALTARHFADGDEFLPQYAWFGQNSTNRTWPVGQLKPNALGLFDVHGNLMEWCQDWYFDDYPSPTNGRVVIDGTDPRVGTDAEIRGGSYDDYRPESIRAADRQADVLFSRSYHFGFRLARTIRSVE